MKTKALVPVVSIINHKAVTTSVEVARVFEKRHDHVLRDIQKTDIPERFLLPRFGEMLGKDSYGRDQLNIGLSRDGFMLLVMGYTGEKARAIKIAYIDAFNKMERRIPYHVAPSTDPQVIEARSLGKALRVQETTVIQQFVEYATAQGSKNAQRYYCNISKMENAALFFLEQKFTNLRDVLDLHQLMTVSVADRIVSKALKEGMELQMNYKDIYIMAKERIENFAELNGKTIIPAGQMRLASVSQPMLAI